MDIVEVVYTDRSIFKMGIKIIIINNNDDCNIGNNKISLHI